MEYEKGYVYKLMDEGGPTDVREPYFKEAVDEMMRARILCAKANAKLPDDLSYVFDLEELFDQKLDDVRILTPFISDFGNRVKFGKGVFINHSAILSASGGIEFEDGVPAKLNSAQRFFLDSADACSDGIRGHFWKQKCFPHQR